MFGFFRFACRGPTECCFFEESGPDVVDEDDVNAAWSYQGAPRSVVTVTIGDQAVDAPISARAPGPSRGDADAAAGMGSNMHLGHKVKGQDVVVRRRPKISAAAAAVAAAAAPDLHDDEACGGEDAARLRPKSSGGAPPVSAGSAPDEDGGSGEEESPPFAPRRVEAQGHQPTSGGGALPYVAGEAPRRRRTDAAPFGAGRAADAREKQALGGKAGGAREARRAGSAGSDGSVALASVSSQRGGARSSSASARPRKFRITITRTKEERKPLGLETEALVGTAGKLTGNRGALRIVRVSEGGLVEVWNRHHLHRQVRAGDLLVEVNGLRGWPDELLAAITERSPELNFEIVRPA